MSKDYPEPNLFGPLPAWGIYVRHAARIQLRDITLALLAADARPAIELDDVAAPDVSGLRLPGRNSDDWVMKNVTALRVRDCDGQSDTGGTS